MKKPAWLIATALIVAMSFTACGPKNTDTVSKDDNTPVVSEAPSVNAKILMRIIPSSVAERHRTARKPSKGNLHSQSNHA